MRRRLSSEQRGLVFGVAVCDRRARWSRLDGLAQAPPWRDASP